MYTLAARQHDFARAQRIPFDNPLVVLDQELMRRCETRNDYAAIKRSMFAVTQDYGRLCELYRGHIQAIREINKRRGHQRARQIARERELSRAREWTEMVCAELPDIADRLLAEMDQRLERATRE